MDCKIFYSWQSDLPNPTNRTFIGDALEKAVKSIRNDDYIKVEPVIDRDTKDVPGSPDIVKTIFDKIEEAQIFVCDVSIINKDANSRLTPNPNVLIELGYAMKTLGEGNFIMVMNTAFGTPEQLPFDLRMRRVITYNMTVDNQDKSTERNKLAKFLERAIRPILEELEDIIRKFVISKQLEEERARELSITERAIISVKQGDRSSSIQVHQFMEWLDHQIKKLAPKFSKKSVDKEDLLIKAINKTEELVIEFASLAEVIATRTESSDAATSLYGYFQVMFLDYYSFSNLFGDLIDDVFDDRNQVKDNLDFYKFIGHELFVTYFSFLIRENRWRLILEIMNEDLFEDNSPLQTYQMIKLNDISQPVELFENSSNNSHSEILNQRHTNGKIAEIVPMQEFIEADFFLFLLSESKTEDSSDSYWHGWSLFHMEQPPKYLLEAKKVDFAEQLLSSLGLETIEELRSLISHAKIKFEQIWINPSIESSYLPLRNFNPEDIGSI
ncbi:MAG: nucleotide-binding protein [Okeania sp. SIO3C4]|nr:nucleotide-binding protein [Okeania sp. SIO3B3]NER01921.1 nucleotide-binding protein [Okeania sp. SIO3C4]